MQKKISDKQKLASMQLFASHPRWEKNGPETARDAVESYAAGELRISRSDIKKYKRTHHDVSRQIAIPADVRKEVTKRAVRYAEVPRCDILTAVYRKYIEQKEGQQPVKKPVHIYMSRENWESLADKSGKDSRTNLIRATIASYCMELTEGMAPVYVMRDFTRLKEMAGPSFAPHTVFLYDRDYACIAHKLSLDSIGVDRYISVVLDSMLFTEDEKTTVSTEFEVQKGEGEAQMAQKKQVTKKKTEQPGAGQECTERMTVEIPVGAKNILQIISIGEKKSIAQIVTEFAYSSRDRARKILG